MFAFAMGPLDDRPRCFGGSSIMREAAEARAEGKDVVVDGRDVSIRKGFVETSCCGELKRCVRKKSQRPARSAPGVGFERKKPQRGGGMEYLVKNERNQTPRSI